MDLTRKEKELVISIIRRHIPSSAEIFFFGSRVSHSPRRGSDLDVLLKDIAPIDLASISFIKDELEESDLPFKVDLLDYYVCSEQMIKNISKNILKVSPK